MSISTVLLWCVPNSDLSLLWTAAAMVTKPTWHQPSNQQLSPQLRRLHHMLHTLWMVGSDRDEMPNSLWLYYWMQPYGKSRTAVKTPGRFELWQRPCTRCCGGSDATYAGRYARGDTEPYTTRTASTTEFCRLYKHKYIQYSGWEAKGKQVTMQQNNFQFHLKVAVKYI